VRNSDSCDIFAIHVSYQVRIILLPALGILPTFCNLIAESFRESSGIVHLHRLRVAGSCPSTSRHTTVSHGWPTNMGVQFEPLSQIFSEKALN